ncbi:MAG: hypothetical protein ACLQOO_04955 [Terriglobia bacterium]
MKRAKPENAIVLLVGAIRLLGCAGVLPSSLRAEVNALSTPSMTAATGPTNVQVVGTNALQAILSYVAPDNNPCTVVVSTNPSLTPMVHDVDPVLFPGSKSDGGGSLQRFFVVGRRKADLGVDGNRYSRALQTFTAHYFSITCDGQSAKGTFTTSNIPLGKTFAEPLQLAPTTSPPGYAFPTLSPNDRAQTIIDPNTGALIRRVSLPGDISNNRSWSFGFADTGSFDICSTRLSNGGYHCIIASNAGVLYWINPATGQSRFLGIPLVPWHSLSSTQQTLYMDSQTSYWDPNNPDFYYLVASLDGKGSDVALIKGTYTGHDVAAAPGANAPFHWQVVEKLAPLLQTFNPEYDPTKFPCAGAGMNGPYLLLSCRRYYQDSEAWIGVVNTVDGSVIGLTRTWSNPTSRWCGLHATLPMGDSAVYSFSPQELWGGTATGPYRVTLQGNVGAADTSLSVSGEPVGQDQVHGDAFLQNAAVGDHFIFKDSAGETVQITNKISSTTWAVARAQNGTRAAGHAAGTALWAACQNMFEIDWQFLSDPNGTDTRDIYYMYDPNNVDHRFTRSPYNATEFPSVRIGAVPGVLGQKPTFILDASPAFAGFRAAAGGNSYGKHPGFGAVSFKTGQTPFFLDQWPFDGGGTYSSNPGVTLLSGQLYKYILGSAPLNPDLPIFGTSGGTPLLDISGPNSVLTGTVSDSYKFCIVKNAGECTSGSQPGDIYVNVPNLQFKYCRGADGPDPSKIDVCVSNLPTYGQAVSQFGMIPANQTGVIQSWPAGWAGLPIYGAGESRVLTNALSGYKNMFYFANARGLPDGSWALFPGSQPLQVFMVQLPPYPTRDGIDRSNYIHVSITIPVMSSSTSVRVDYGYEENGARNSYYCTQRQERCSLTSTAGNTVTLQGIPQRILFFHLAYLDRNGNDIADHYGAAEVDHAAVTPLTPKKGL